jgi:serine acetyltransferase
LGEDELSAAPVLGDSVSVGAGAIILGPYVIGDAAIIGAGAVVLSDVPEGATVVGNPGRILASKGSNPE